MLIMQFFDISTTVDPGYVISLIRKLLPPDGRNGTKSPGIDTCNTSTQGSKTDGGEESRAFLSQNGVLNDPNSEIAAMDAVEHTGRDGGCDGSHDEQGELVGADAWEEYGCIVWDLAASQTHAEFMVHCFVHLPHVAHFSFDPVCASLNIHFHERFVVSDPFVVSNALTLAQTSFVTMRGDGWF